MYNYTLLKELDGSIRVKCIKVSEYRFDLHAIAASTMTKDTDFRFSIFAKNSVGLHCFLSDFVFNNVM